MGESEKGLRLFGVSVMHERGSFLFFFPVRSHTGGRHSTQKTPAQLPVVWHGITNVQQLLIASPNADVPFHMDCRIKVGIA